MIGAYWAMSNKVTDGLGCWEFRALLTRPSADGKKLLLWREVLVLMDRSLLPEGSGWNRRVHFEFRDLERFRLGWSTHTHTHTHIVLRGG